jgi:hypothetical protein
VRLIFFFSQLFWQLTSKRPKTRRQLKLPRIYGIPGRLLALPPCRIGFQHRLTRCAFWGVPRAPLFLFTVKASLEIFTRRNGFLIDTGKPVVGYGFLLWTGKYRWFYFIYSIGRKIFPLYKTWQF